MFKALFDYFDNSILIKTESLKEWLKKGYECTGRVYFDKFMEIIKDWLIFTFNLIGFHPF